MLDIEKTIGGLRWIHLIIQRAIHSGKCFRRKGKLSNHGSIWRHLYLYLVIEHQVQDLADRYLNSGYIIALMTYSHLHSSQYPASCDTILQDQGVKGAGTEWTFCQPNE